MEGSLNQRVTWKRETRLSAVSAGVAGRGEGGGGSWSPPRLLFSIDLPSPPPSPAPTPRRPVSSLPTSFPPSSPSLLLPAGAAFRLPQPPPPPARPYLLFVTATTAGNLSPRSSRHCQPFCQVRCRCYGLAVMRRASRVSPPVAGVRGGPGRVFSPFSTARRSARSPSNGIYAKEPISLIKARDRARRRWSGWRHVAVRGVRTERVAESRAHTPQWASGAAAVTAWQGGRATPSPLSW